MPVTKREAHYGSPKELINYILDEKHNGEKVGQVSSINCNPETALLEFKDIQRKYNMKGTRVAYHIIQSFSPKDDITEEQANEIGKRLCEELYPDYQCIISTHIDKGHIHNHICLNAISLDGKKLEDRLSNEKEGLYGLSDTSDKIAAEYGCFIMSRKTYLKTKTKDYYHEGMTLLFQQGENMENYSQILEEYKTALKVRENVIDQLYNEIKIIKKLRI